MMNTKDFDSKAKISFSVDQKKKLKEFSSMAKEATRLMDDFKFYYAAEKIYHYFWHTFCDKIIEESKAALTEAGPAKEKQATQAMLLEILSGSLKLLHPFMPFITEEIYQQLPRDKKAPFLMVEEWPL